MTVPQSPRARYPLGIIIAVAIALLAVLTRLVVRPLHEAGIGQSVLGFVQGFDFILQVPGLYLAHFLKLRQGYHTTLGAWSFAVMANAVLYCLAGLAIGLLLRGTPDRPQTDAPVDPSAPQAAPPVSRRRLLATGVKLLGVASAAALGYGFLLESRWFGVTRRQISIAGLPPELDGLRILHLTDIHLGPWLSAAYVREVVDAANELQPDLICLTGDYVHHSPAYVTPVAEELGRLQAKIAVVGVLGNHDWWEDAPLMRREFGKVGIQLLDNDRRILTPGRRLVTSETEGLAFCGVGDLWQDRPDYARALDGLPTTMPRLLLSHNPDVAEERGLTSGGWRVDLMLSGHTHGGQIVLPGVGAPATSSRYGDKYAQGLIEGPVCRVFVCRGIGVSALPIRFRAPPEMALLELRRMPDAPARAGQSPS